MNDHFNYKIFICRTTIAIFQINGNLTNTGNDITLYVDNDIISHLNVSGGPLQYNYHLHQMKLHFGDKEHSGSEHTVNGLSFPAEVTLLHYFC